MAAKYETDQTKNDPHKQVDYDEDTQEPPYDQNGEPRIRAGYGSNSIDGGAVPPVPGEDW